MKGKGAFKGPLLNFFIIPVPLLALGRARVFFKGDGKRAVEGFYAEGVQNLSSESLNKLCLSLYYLAIAETGSRKRH